MSEILTHPDRTTSLLLLDLYGALLTERTKEVLEFYLAEDLSLAEIAENLAISRQGVHDAVNRGMASLLDFENRLRFLERRQKAEAELSLARKAVAAGDRQGAENSLQTLTELLW